MFKIFLLIFLTDEGQRSLFLSYFVPVRKPFVLSFRLKGESVDAANIEQQISHIRSR
jgi:hypothetical protein